MPAFHRGKTAGNMIPRRSRLLLLVENSDLGAILQLALRDYDLEWHARADPAADAVRRRSFDLGIIDLGFGGRPSGLDSIRDWRLAGAEFPIIAISDVPQPLLAVESLDAGADDFLRKPFHYEELQVRIRKLLSRDQRRTPIHRAGGVLLSREPFEFAGVRILPDLVARFPDGSEERIRPKQHGILRAFADHAGRLLLKDELVNAVWGSDANRAGHSVNEYVSTLRRMFVRRGIDFNGMVVSEPKAGWRIAARAVPPGGGAGA
jgi:DNA-binding response OmpR family regulator